MFYSDGFNVNKTLARYRCQLQLECSSCLEKKVPMLRPNKCCVD